MAAAQIIWYVRRARKENAVRTHVRVAAERRGDKVAPDGGSAVKEMDRRHLAHPFTALAQHERTGPTLMASGSGVTLTDVDGREYLDAMAGLWCVNVGYGNRELADAMSEQASRLAYYHSFSSMGTEAPAVLAERLCAMAPVPVDKVFFGSSGSDANDTQVKLVWYYNNILGRPQKKKIISRVRGYHGVTIMSAGLTGLANLHAGFDLPLPMIRHVRPPHRLWEREPGATDAEFVASLAQELDDLIVSEGPDTVAAFIAEPVMAAGGVIVPPDGYFAAIQEVLARHDVLLIADEVVSGFGRLGVPFGSTAVGARPDLMTIAKGVTSAYIPLSACLITPHVWEVLKSGEAKYGVFGHGYTYSAHTLAAATALANLDIIERDGLVEQAGRRGAHLHARLHDSFGDHPLVGEIRGTGLVAAVELVASKDPMTAFEPSQRVGPRVAAAALERGVITRALPAADTLSFSPPFVVTDSELDAMVDGVRAAVDAVGAELGIG